MYYNVDGKQLEKQYKDHISDFRQWKQAVHAQEYILFDKNIGESLSMDETCLSQGELYTILTNKTAKGKKGSLIAMIKGTRSEDVISVIEKISRTKRLHVKEITIDLSPSMKLIAKNAFPFATIVSDRFHVQKLMNEALTDLRVDYRWQAIDQENHQIKEAKKNHQSYVPETFENGDTRRQLLARSRHVVMKNQAKWTSEQQKRALILFREYPLLEQAYKISMGLTQIYNSTTKRSVALTKLAHWYNQVDALNCKFFNSVILTMQNNYQSISNYFNHRSTNASAESFNAKVKAFRSQFRGVRDIPFFLFRLSNIYA